MDRIDIVIFPKHTDQIEEEAYQGYSSRWQSIRRHEDLEIIISVESVTQSDAAREVFVEIVDEIHRDIRMHIRIVRELLSRGETGGFSGTPCIDITKTTSGYIKLYDHWGSLEKAALGNTFRDAISTRIQAHKMAEDEVQKREKK